MIQEIIQAGVAAIGAYQLAARGGLINYIPPSSGGVEERLWTGEYRNVRARNGELARGLVPRIPFWHRYLRVPMEYQVSDPREGSLRLSLYDDRGKLVPGVQVDAKIVASPDTDPASLVRRFGPDKASNFIAHLSPLALQAVSTLNGRSINDLLDPTKRAQLLQEASNNYGRLVSDTYGSGVFNTRLIVEYINLPKEYEERLAENSALQARVDILGPNRAAATLMAEQGNLIVVDTGFSTMDDPSSMRRKSMRSQMLKSQVITGVVASRTRPGNNTQDFITYE